MNPQDGLNLWRKALVASVRREAPDLTARQHALMLTVYLTEPPHTVRGLAATLNVYKPVVTRALDRLGESGFVRRRPDEADKRSVLVQRSVYLSEFGEIISGAARTVSKAGDDDGEVERAA